jgi:hypothetical protein
MTQKTQLAKDEQQKFDSNHQKCRFAIQISAFLKRIEKEPRFGTAHIALYLALLAYWNAQSNRNPISVYNWQIMKSSKISSTSTAAKVLKDLCETSLIEFRPSFYHQVPSQIFILDLSS